jgi:hypothetical protein
VLVEAQGRRLLFDVRRDLRRDVAHLLDQPNFVGCGFSLILPRNALPPGRYQVGFIIRHDGQRESIMTDTWIERGADS